MSRWDREAETQQAFRGRGQVSMPRGGGVREQRGGQNRAEPISQDFHTQQRIRTWSWESLMREARGAVSPEH